MPFTSQNPPLKPRGRFVNSLRRGRTAMLAVAAAAVVTLVTACSGGGGAPAPTATDEAPQSGGIVNIVVNNDVSSFDPATCRTIANQMQCNAVFGSLLIFDNESNDFVPKMAESFTPSDDGLTWTLKLHPGVEFSDGTPFDADAVVYNWDRILDPKTLSPAIGTAKTMTWTATDETTVTIELEKPNYQLPWAMASSNFAMIGSPEALAALGADFGSTPVGAGPFLLDSWTRGTAMSLSRNDTYWDAPRPYVDGLTFTIVTDPAIQLANLESGESQMVVAFYAPEQALPDGFVDTMEVGIGGTGLLLNTTLPGWEDKDIRVALAKLLDQKQFNAAVFPQEETAETLINPVWPFSSDEPLYTPDVEGAQKLVDGYLKRNNLDSLTLDVYVPSTVPQTVQVWQLFQQQVAKVDGLALNIIPAEGAVISEKRNAHQLPALSQFLAGSNPDQLYELFHTGAGANLIDYSNSTVDKALELTRSSNDPDEVNEAYKTAVAQITKDAVYIIYKRTYVHYLHPTTLHNVIPTDGTRVLTDEFWLEQ